MVTARTISPGRNLTLQNRLYSLHKNVEYRHSERRFCAKNPSLFFVLNQEGFFVEFIPAPAGAQNDDRGIFSESCLAAEVSLGCGCAAQ